MKKITNFEEKFAFCKHPTGGLGLTSQEYQEVTIG